MSVSLYFTDFSCQTRDGISIDDILNEIQRVIEGAKVPRAGAIIDYERTDGSGNKFSIAMGVEVHHKLGCSLNYAPNQDKECWSVGDESRLTEVIENDDCNLWFAGLYIRPEKALRAIEEFCRTGKPDTNVDWIDVLDLPGTLYAE